MSRKSTISNILFPVMLFITGFCFSQNSVYKEINYYLNESNLDSAKIKLEKAKKSKKSIFEKGLFSYYSGVLLKKIDNHDLGYKALKSSISIFKEVDSLEYWANANYEIYDLLEHQNNLKINSKPYLDNYMFFAKLSQNPLMMARAYSKIAGIHSDKDDFENTLLYYNKTIKELKKNEDTLRIAIIEMNIGTEYYSVKKDPDSALYFYKKALPIFKKYKKSRLISNNYNNQAQAYSLIGNYKRVIELYEKTDTIKLIDYDKKTRAVYYKNKVKAYKKVNDFRNAFIFSEKLISISDSINDTKQNIAISEIKEKYDNATLRAEKAEGEKQILIEQKNRAKNKNIAIVLGILLLFGTIIFLLIQKNTKRKQLLAEQDKELEKQKVATLLKDQEINSINAMIEGQEKERQRIANDLHDDLGGLMATVKLQFNVLKEQQTPELFNKTNNLLDQAYNKVRSIAHAKNSGVIAKQGLLKAVKNMAHNVSSASTIDIEVTDYGLESRLENSLELSIFRIIQELTTNIIKHAEATHATISLTNHEDSLNIMIEDNGKGFNTNKVVQNNGMGLHSIEKRVEHLEGEFKIESQPNQGTTIIIDIPL